MLKLIFIVITLLSFILFYYATGKDKKVLFISAVWLVLIGSIAYSGFFENINTKPPRFLLMLLGAIGLCFYFYRILEANKISTNYLLSIHTLRLPVELVLYELFLQKQVPVLMTFQGWNFDILMGLSAILILIYLLFTKRKLPGLFVWVWNIAGVLFLTTIVVIAILSSPLPIQQFAFDQPNVAILKFPFIFLPAYVVPVVFLSHVFSIRMR